MAIVVFVVFGMVAVAVAAFNFYALHRVGPPPITSYCSDDGRMHPIFFR